MNCHDGKVMAIQERLRGKNEKSFKMGQIEIGKGYW